MPRKKSAKKVFLISATVALFFAAFVVRLSWDKGPVPQSDECCGVKSFSYTFDPKDKIAYFEGKKLTTPDKIPSFLTGEKDKAVLGVVSGEEKWIEVDLSEQKLIAHEGEQVFLESAVSSGLARSPTPSGEFKVWYKTKSQKMSGGSGSSYYYLPNVPYIMFFENEEVFGYRGYSLHGTYWHNDFGNPRSHGCVNLPTPIAEQLFYWTTPDLSEEQKIVRATSDNPGTRIVIHE